MDVLQIFKKKAISTDSLVRKYRALTHQKEKLKDQSDQLKRSALVADVDNLAEQLHGFRTESELADLAMEAVRKQLSELLTKQIERDFSKLPQQKDELDLAFATADQEAGVKLAELAQILANLGTSHGSVISQGIQQLYSDLAKKTHRAEAMSVFSTGYAKASAEPFPGTDFRALKKELSRVEQLAPGSPAALQHVKSLTRALLATTEKPGPNHFRGQPGLVFGNG